MGGMEYIEGDAEQEVIFHGSKAVLEVLKKKSNLKKRVKSLVIQTEQCDKKITHLVSELNRVRKELLLNRSVSDEISTLRDEIIALKRKEDSEDSTVREIADTRRERGLLITRLQKMCRHEFLVGYSGYEGDRSYDYDNAYSGRRMCVVCGLTDTEKSASNGREGVYVLLPAGNWRFDFFSSDVYGHFGLVQQDRCDKLIEPTSDRILGIIDRKDFFKLNIWVPSEELRPLFLRA